MKNRTVTITVSASVTEVFSFLSNPETLPLWAVSFCKSIRKEDDRWLVTTAEGGELAFALDVDRSSGCIDMLAGPTVELMESFPIRVFKVDNGQTAASFTMFKSDRPGMTDTMFEMHYRSLVQEVESLISRFGGGEMSSGLPGPSKVYLGLVTEKLEMTRNYYASYFGFRVIFDSPFYVHMGRESGEQIGVLLASSDAGQTEFEKGTTGEGLWVSIEVDDVDAEFSRLTGEGLLFRDEPTDQPWGERTCVTVDPNGVLIYISEQTGKMDPSMKQYVTAAACEFVG